MKNGRGINVLGVNLPSDVLWWAGAATIVYIGINMMGQQPVVSAYSRRSFETSTDRQTPPDMRTIRDRVAAILEKISAFRENSLEARQRHREAIRAVVTKYRTQIVAVVQAFRVKLAELRAANAPISEFEKAKADTRQQIIALIQAMQTEIHDVPKPQFNLDEIRKRIEDRRKLFEGFPPRG